MTKVEIMDVLAKMNEDEQKYAHKLLCRAFAGRRLDKIENMPNLVNLVNKRYTSDRQIRKYLMDRYNDNDLVSEIMDVYFPCEPLVPTNVVYNVLGKVDGYVSVDWLIGHGDTLVEYGHDAVCDALHNLYVDGLVEWDVIDGKEQWRVK